MQGNTVIPSLRRLGALSILVTLAGCSSQQTDTWPSPGSREIVSSIQRTPEERLLVASSSSGGGAGDITYRILACKAHDERCELLASIDTNGQPAPGLLKTEEGVALIVNRNDYIADFRNFARELASLQPGELYLNYRTIRG
jgi:hypothetical protein